jgi:hypothetical protein
MTPYKPESSRTEAWANFKSWASKLGASIPLYTSPLKANSKTQDFNPSDVTTFTQTRQMKQSQTLIDILKDQDNNIVVVRENPNIITLAMQTGGKYLKYSLNNNDN